MEIYIQKTSIILLDENNSDILKQKKKIDKSRKKCILYCPGPGISFGFNILFF